MRISDWSSDVCSSDLLLGADARPWLPAAFCAAAALPHLHPDLRRALLQSISEAAATASGWSTRAPAFFPSWVEKIDTAPLANSSVLLPASHSPAVRRDRKSTRLTSRH